MKIWARPTKPQPNAHLYTGICALTHAMPRSAPLARLQIASPEPLAPNTRLYPPSQTAAGAPFSAVIACTNSS